MKNNKKAIYTLFFFSGMAGLMYEVIWVRKLVVVFGSTTHSTTATISAFLAGLAIGSFLAGKYIRSTNGGKLLRIYAGLEAAIGLMAILSVYLIQYLPSVFRLVSDGTDMNFGVCFITFLLSSVIIIIPTICMGASLPVLVSYVQSKHDDVEKNVSILYAINTFGAVCGVVATGFILFELFGIIGALFCGVGINFVVALMALQLSRTDTEATKEAIVNHATVHQPQLSRKSWIILFVFGLSGLLSIAYEVLWIRVLTPVTGTFIYAFAVILAAYLFGIAFGSLLYRFVLTQLKNHRLFFIGSQIGIGVFGLFSVLLIASPIASKTLLIVAGVVLPATVCMGVSFPAVIAWLKDEGSAGNIVGISYFFNTLGNIGGGYVASFVLIPLIGSMRGIILLVVCNVSLVFVLLTVYGKVSTSNRRTGLISAGLISILLITIFLFNIDLHDYKTSQRIQSAVNSGAPYYFIEDSVTSVLGYESSVPGGYKVFIDGVETTNVVSDTKIMAHLPISIHPDPRKMLVVAFGMGTTYRSALLHEIDTDVVDLSSSVFKMFEYFFPNAKEVFSNPNGHLIINDGRNYVILTDKRYDIVTIDPPPPFNSAGTTVLYSREFYENLKSALNIDGLVCQWMYFGSREDDIGMAIRSFVEAFPHVEVFSSHGTTEGVFLIGSLSPIAINMERVEQIFTADFVTRDFEEVLPVSAEEVFAMHIGSRDDILSYVGQFRPVTDNNPRTEYFLIRHIFADYPMMTRSILRENI